jgi:hypothetical protein
MSNNNSSPKKKAAAKKPVANKAAPKKAADGAKKKLKARDGDGDGFVQDGTEHERRKPGRPKKKVEQAPAHDPLADTVEDITNAVEAMFEEVKDGASEVAETVKKTIDNVIRASDVIKPSLRKRMLAWFKRK